MKRITLCIILLSLTALSGCEKEKSAHTKTSTSSSKAVVTVTATSSSSQLPESTTSSSIAVESTEQISDTASTVPNQASSTVPTEAQLQETTYVTTAEQAKQRIIDTQPLVSNPNLQLDFYMQIDAHFLFSLYSLEIAQQGGSGTVGFYRVTPLGEVFETNAYGSRL